MFAHATLEQSKCVVDNVGVFQNIEVVLLAAFILFLSAAILLQSNNSVFGGLRGALIKTFVNLRPSPSMYACIYVHVCMY